MGGYVHSCSEARPDREIFQAFQARFALASAGANTQEAKPKITERRIETTYQGQGGWSSTTYIDTSDWTQVTAYSKLVTVDDVDYSVRAVRRLSALDVASYTVEIFQGDKQEGPVLATASHWACHGGLMGDYNQREALVLLKGAVVMAVDRPIEITAIVPKGTFLGMSYGKYEEVSALANRQ